MVPAPSPPPAMRPGRRTPARLIVAGATLGFAAVALDAGVGLAGNLAFLQGSPSPVPWGVALLDAVMMGFAVPIGLFLVLCGLALHLRSRLPPGRSLPFRAALSGAGLGLAAGLILGLLDFSLALLPSDLFTQAFVQTLVYVVFAASVAAGAGLFIAFCGIAALIRETAAPAAGRPWPGVRAPRGKSIYRVVPTAR